MKSKFLTSYRISSSYYCFLVDLHCFPSSNFNYLRVNGSATFLGPATFFALLFKVFLDLKVVGFLLEEVKFNPYSCLT
jgi:hypothetical protein